jgi:hypothetical protein
MKLKKKKKYKASCYDVFDKLQKRNCITETKGSHHWLATERNLDKILCNFPDIEIKK